MADMEQVDVRTLVALAELRDAADAVPLHAWNGSATTGVCRGCGFPGLLGHVEHHARCWVPPLEKALAAAEVELRRLGRR